MSDQAVSSTPAPASEQSTFVPEPPKKSITEQFREAFAQAPKPEGEPVPELASTSAPTEPPKAESKAEDKLLKGPMSPNELKKRDAAIKDAAAKRKLAQERDELAAKVKTSEAFEQAKARKDAWTMLKLMGYEKPEQFQADLAQGSPSPRDLEVEALKKRIDEAEQARQAQAYQVQVDSVRSSVVQFIQNDERFELARLNNGPDVVLAVMNQLWEQIPAHERRSVQPKSLMEQAAQYVENYLDAEAEKLAAVPKFQKKVGKVASPAKPSPSSASREPPRSLSNNMSPTTAPAKAPKDADRVNWLAEELRKTLAK